MTCLSIVRWICLFDQTFTIYHLPFTLPLTVVTYHLFSSVNRLTLGGRMFELNKDMQSDGSVCYHGNCINYICALLFAVTTCTAVPVDYKDE